MFKYDVSDIFTPSSPTRLTFVERHSLNNLLVDTIHTKGKQMIIYGHTGTGKSTLLYNKLSQTYEEFIVTRCTSDLTFQQLIINAFDQLGKFYISTRSSGKETKLGVNLASEYEIIKGTLNFDNTLKKAEELKPIVPPQLTPQKLASFFGSINSCWVVDDFHKLVQEEKRHLAQWMKVFMDESINYPYVKIIAIGAVGKAKEVIELDRELNNRVTEIYVPYMTESELKELIVLGESKLNINIDEKVKQKIIKFSSGLPSITHQLCLNLCLSQGLYTTSDSVITFDFNDFNDAITSFLQQNSSYLSDRYEKAIHEEKEHSVPIYQHILKCIISI